MFTIHVAIKHSIKTMERVDWTFVEIKIIFINKYKINLKLKGLFSI